MSYPIGYEKPNDAEKQLRPADSVNKKEESKGEDAAEYGDALIAH